MKFFSVVILFFSLTALNADDDAHEHHEKGLHEDHHEGSHDHEFEEHSSHEHGHATANISYIDDSLKIELQLPSIDVFGFEHAPHDQKEDEIVFTKLSYLEEIGNVIATDPACAESSSTVDSDILEYTDEHEEETHSDVRAQYVLHCGHDIEISFKLFDEFTSLEKIAVQYVSKQQQELFTVTPNSPTITLHR